MAGPRISRAAKAKARQRLGSLKHQRVHEKTANIYNAALALFSAWLQCEQQPLPQHESEMDPLACAYAEVLWQEGESKQDLANLLSALEFEEGSLRYHLRCSWRLYGAWKKAEMQQQCTPMLAKWCRALAGAALARSWPEEAFLFLLAFDCLLRSVEAATLCPCNLEINEAATMGSVCLSASKGQTRSGIKEMVTISDRVLVRWAKALKEMKRPGDLLMVGGSKALRRKFKTCVEDIGLQDQNLQLYSLRRGGATEVFRSSGSFHEVADRGRWKNLRTARIYVDSALQDIAQLETAEHAKLKRAERRLAQLIF
jgi:hypothetical protein